MFPLYGSQQTQVPQQLKSAGQFAAKQGIKFEVSLQLHLASAQERMDFPVGSLSQFNI